MAGAVAPISIVMPAKAGDPVRRGSSAQSLTSLEYWIPAFAGMTTECAFAISRPVSPEVCRILLALKSEGAGKTGCLLHPRSRVRFCA